MTGREAGAGTALAVAVVAALLIVFALVAPLAGVLEAQRRAAGAADAAALAAADAAMGVALGVPCERAGDVARAAGVRLASCAQRGRLVRVVAAVTVLGAAVRAEAVAGPPAAPPGRP